MHASTFLYLFSEYLWPLCFHSVMKPLAFGETLVSSLVTRNKEYLITMESQAWTFIILGHHLSIWKALDKDPAFLLVYPVRKMGKGMNLALAVTSITGAS